MINFEKATSFCYEDISLIENYTLAINDITQTWICHHRLEIQENKLISRQELIDSKLYYNRPASELIFLTKSTHSTLHGKNRPKEVCEKISKSLKGKCKGKKISKETRKKLEKSFFKKGHIPWNKGKKASIELRKKLSDSHKGQIPWNKGQKLN